MIEFVDRYVRFVSRIRSMLLFFFIDVGQEHEREGSTHDRSPSWSPRRPMNKLTKDGPRWYSSFSLFFSFSLFPLYIEIFEMGFRSFRLVSSWRFSTILHYFIYTAITKSRTFRWLVWPRSRSHSASLSSNASEKPEGGSSLGTNRFPDPSRSWSRLEQELLDWCLGLPNPEIGPKLERVSSLVWRASCNILREATTEHSLIYFVSNFPHDYKTIPYLDLPLPGNDFLSKIGEGSVDVLDSGPWYRKSESKRETQRYFPGE